MVKTDLPLCSDHSNIKAAYEAMKNVACLINERKRKLESIDKIARWQVSIVGWEVSGRHAPPPTPSITTHTLPDLRSSSATGFNVLGLKLYA